MNREEKLARLKDLRDCSLNYESYEVKEDDAEVLMWAINELEEVEELDRLTDNICNLVNKDFENDKVNDYTLEMINALAKLISARAM
ncbi:hypothetical protein [Clostridium sp.]|uniref:hypothetical protein n=1 Tax=Clostridium sp. TaxID=1506 RepID=UPI0026067E7D|nr:hypothetical protein [Clostridium sp.]